MARVDFRVSSAGVKPDTKVLLTSQGSDVGTASGDLFNQGGVLKFHTGVGSKTISFSDSNITGTAAAWTTARTVNFNGAGSDVTGSFTISGAADVSNVVLTIAANSVALGTDTTGNYIATIAGTADQVTVTGSGTETAAVTLSLPQSIATTSSPSFAGLTLSGDLAVNGSDITTTGTGTATVFNTNALTVNIGGAATAVSIGASTGTTTVNNNLAITGNLTINGTTTTVNSTTVTIDDPIFTLGGDTAPGADDNKDRGIEFRYHNGTVAQLGFFGFDDSSGKFTFLTGATNTAEVFSGTKGTIDAGSVEALTLFVDSIEIDTTGATTNQILQYNGTKFAPATFTAGSNAFSTIAVSGQTNVDADSTTDTLTLVNGTGITITTNATTDAITVTNAGVTSIAGTTNQITASGGTGAVTLSLPATINVNTTGTAAAWTTARTVTFSGGDVTGSFTISGAADVTAVNLTIAANSVALGTDTTGAYVASLVAGTGVTLTNNTGLESATPTIAIGQDVATTAAPTFAALNISDGATNAHEEFTSTTLTSTTATSVMSLASATYRSLKYVIQAVQGTNYLATEIRAVHDGTNVSYTEYATIVIGTAPASFDVDINSGNVRLVATSATSSSTVYRVRVTAIAV